MKNKVSARAHTNIALIKYWGKENQDLIIPYNSSLSLTLDHFYTDTTVTFDDTLSEDHFYLNNQQKSDKKVSAFLDIVRQKAKKNMFAKVESINHVPTSAGLASSASAYAALATAASAAIGLDLTKRELSRLARRGSGSASRSIFGGLVEWKKGHNDEDSFAVPIEETIDWDIQMIAIMINSHEKEIGSRSGMQHSVDTSPFYHEWVKSSERDLIAMKQAISEKNLDQVGQIAENNAMKMHATTLSANPSFTYFNPDSIRAMDAVRELRQAGITCYFTMDAGPNVKIICSKAETPYILNKLSPLFGSDKLLVAKPGPGVTLI
ncbi:diphosphomevalonate decarboxylase [Dellaglioa sp. BT-FLS60]